MGRVRTIWRVALGGLWLAVRALAARAGLTLALTALTEFAVGVAAAGAMYLRAAGESLLQDRLAATSPFSAGLLVERKVATRACFSDQSRCPAGTSRERENVVGLPADAGIVSGS